MPIAFDHPISELIRDQIMFVQLVTRNFILVTCAPEMLYSAMRSLTKYGCGVWCRL